MINEGNLFVERNQAMKYVCLEHKINLDLHNFQTETGTVKFYSTTKTFYL